MFFVKVLFILLIPFGVSSHVLVPGSVTSDQYGPFKLIGNEFSVCKGPKDRNVSTYYGKITNTESSFTTSGKITILSRTKAEELNIYTLLVQDKRKSKRKYLFKNPCQHFFLRSLFMSIFRTDKCVFNKGTYGYNEDLSKHVHVFTGNSFFYGTYVSKIIAVSRTENIFCVVLNITLTKKT